VWFHPRSAGECSLDVVGLINGVEKHQDPGQLRHKHWTWLLILICNNAQVLIAGTCLGLELDSCTLAAVSVAAFCSRSKTK